MFKLLIMNDFSLKHNTQEIEFNGVLMGFNILGLIEGVLLSSFNHIRGGLLLSGVEEGGGGGGAAEDSAPSFISLTTYANEVKFGTVIIYYIRNNLVKKIGLSRVNFC